MLLLAPKWEGDWALITGEFLFQSRIDVVGCGLLDGIV